MAQTWPIAPLVLENEWLHVVVNSTVGGTITSLTHRGTGMSVLGTTPWDPLPVPYLSTSPADEAAWLARYGGGWPLLFPNGGDGCTFDGVTHGFHGEASVAPWRAVSESGRILLSRRFYTVPVTMERELRIDGDVLVVRETVHMVGGEPVRIMWTHHPTFGADLLAGNIAIETSASSVVVDDGYDPDTNPLQPGATGRWPVLPGKDGPCDLSRPTGRVASLVYLQNFETPWVALRRLDGAIGAVLSWQAEIFPVAWLWFELNGTAGPPWYGRARLIGVEPSTSWPGTGLADVARRGGRLLTLNPGEVVATELRLHVFQPAGPVQALDSQGRVAS